MTLNEMKQQRIKWIGLRSLAINDDERQHANDMIEIIERKIANHNARSGDTNGSQNIPQNRS